MKEGQSAEVLDIEASGSIIVDEVAPSVAAKSPKKVEAESVEEDIEVDYEID